MSPSTWGPPTWIFIHTLAAKVKPESFPIIGSQLINIIIRICYNLPCPECSQHAKEFWSKVKLANIKDKTDLINIIFIFHNIVNKRKNFRPFKYIDLQYYTTRKVIETHNNFAKNFNTTGNLNLINDSFHRSRMLHSLKKWLMANLIYFYV